MSILTKEGIQKILNDDWLLMDDCEGLENCTVIKELARMALAAMDSEPVAWDYEWASYITGEGPRDFKRIVECEAPPEWAIEEGLARNIIPLYRHAPPVPEGYVTVPKEPTESMLIASYMFAHVASTRESWAAMLASAPQLPGSEPVLPQRWIPVSERMPEDRTQVILWDAEIGEVTSGHYSHKTQTFYHCGDAIENEITHWMLPPSAPQEVK